MREKTRTLYRSHNLKIIPGVNFVIANTLVVFRILLALNLKAINLDISGLCTERQKAEDRGSLCDQG